MTRRMDLNTYAWFGMPNLGSKEILLCPLNDAETFPVLRMSWFKSELIFAR